MSTFFNQAKLLLDRKSTSLIITTLATLWALFALTFKIHGFSIEQWGPHLELESRPFHQLGKSRSVRSDDWLVGFTLWQMQETARPAYPSVNPLLGSGQTMTVSSYPIYSRHWSTLFKPHTWGFQFGTDFGMSWLWLFNSTGLFLCLFWLLRLTFPASITAPQSGLLSLAFVFSNFLQFWSYIPSPGIVYALLLFLSWIGLHRAQGKRLALTYVAWIWSGVSFALVLYPPFQIVLTHGLLVAGAVFLLFSRPQWRRIGAAVSGVLIMFGLLGAYVFENREIILAMQGTVYPGKRVSLGGDQSWIRLFQDVLIPLRSVRDFSNLNGNICEAAGFLHFVPLLLILCWTEWKNFKPRYRAALILITLYFAFLMIGWYFGFPMSVAKFTGMALVPAGRSILALGLINLALITLWLSLDQFAPTRFQKIAGSIWIAVNALVLIWTLKTHSELGFNKGQAFLLFLGVTFASGMLVYRRGLAFCAALAALSLFLTLAFNPIVFGGAKALVSSSPILQLIKKTEAENGPGNWIVFDSATTSHAPLLMGAKAWTGVYLYPQTELWKYLDPERQFETSWNRYAHLVFRPLPPGRPFRILSPSPDTVIVETSLDNERFLKLPLRYILLEQGTKGLVPSILFREIGKTQKWSVWKKN